MARLIEDRRGARTIIMELTEDEAALIRGLLGRCNTCGSASKAAPGLFYTFNKLDLPVVNITDYLGDKPNLTAKKG